MNKTSIEYADYSWNPITGCRRECDYCYAAKMVKRFGHYGGSFEPQFHPDRLRDPVRSRKPGVIFVCDMGDIFSPGVKKQWRDRVKAAADAAPEHTYLWLTKNPQYDESWVRPNWWLGATITGPGDAWRREIYIPNTGLKYNNLWYSYEPLLGIPDARLFWDAGQIVIGAATNCKLPYSTAWAKKIIERYKILSNPKVFVKANGSWAGAPKDLAWK